MSEMKHTPGPWVVHGAKYPGGYSADIFLPDAESVVSATHIARCFLPAPYKPSIDSLHAMATARELAPIAEANARLIAAAPDLLSELDVRVGDLVMLRRAIEEGDPKAGLLLRVDDMLRETRAAIAKAGAA